MSANDDASSEFKKIDLMFPNRARALKTGLGRLRVHK
jgi:hypothetical protein